MPRAKYDFMVYGVKDVTQCAAPLRVLQAELPTINFPEGWKFIVTCNPLAWEFARKVAGSPPTDAAFTDLTQRITVLNSAKLRQRRPQYRHILVHELGHVRCNCNDEWKAETFAMSTDRPGPAPVTAVGKGASAGH